MNEWNLSGEILRHGIKGKKYPKLWIHVGISSPPGSNLVDNNVFINFDIDANPNSKAGKIAEFIKDKLKDSNYIFVSNVMVANIPKSKKLDDGTWETTEVTGLKGKIYNIYLGDTRFPVINQGCVEGNVDKYGYDAEHDTEKFIIEDKYRNPKTSEWKARPVPVLNAKPNSPSNIAGKRAFVQGSICGVTSTGESKTYVWANQQISMR